MYPLLPSHVRNEQFCTADTAVRKVFAMPRRSARSRGLRGDPYRSSTCFFPIFSIVSGL